MTNRILRRRQVVVSSTPVLVCRDSHRQPEVMIHRQGAKVESIEVRCGCGERIILDCENSNQSEIAHEMAQADTPASCDLHKDID